MIRPELLPGVYALESIVTDRAGEPVDETGVVGMLTVTPGGRLSVVNASTLNTMAYTGPYWLEGEQLTITLEGCCYEDMVGKSIRRRILELTEERLVLDAMGVKSGLHSVIRWKRIATVR